MIIYECFKCRLQGFRIKPGGCPRCGCPTVRVLFQGAAFKLFEITHRRLHQTETIGGENDEEACYKLGWKVSDCEVKELVNAAATAPHMIQPN